MMNATSNLERCSFCSSTQTARTKDTRLPIARNPFKKTAKNTAVYWAPHSRERSKSEWESATGMCASTEKRLTLTLLCEHFPISTTSDPEPVGLKFCAPDDATPARVHLRTSRDIVTRFGPIVCSLGNDCIGHVFLYRSCMIGPGDRFVS